jgi:hypothetical protein
MCVICVILGGGYMFDDIGSVHMSHLRRRIHACHMCHIRRRIHVRWHRQCAYVASEEEDTCVSCVILGGGYMFDGIGNVHMSHLHPERVIFV